MAKQKQDEPKHVFGCPTQGIPQALLPESQIRKWFERELALWGEQEWPPIYIERLGTYDPNLLITYGDLLRTLLEADPDKFRSRLAETLGRANNLDLLLLQSPLGSSIRQMPTGERTYMAVLLTAESRLTGVQNVDTDLRRQKALFSLSPMMLVGADLADSRALRDLSMQSVELANRAFAAVDANEELQKKEWERFRSAEAAVSDERKAEFDAWKATKEAELGAIHDIYHKHVQTEAAATYWQRKARNSTLIAWGAFAVFGLMVALALGLGWANLTAIKDYIRDLADSSTTVSLTPVVVVTVPVLAYAWILRHLSRVFIQNLALADDATYRGLMTMTFLGFNRDPTSGITQAERAIILNALFRPAPPNTTEDGPPAGLLDLITKKPG